MSRLFKTLFVLFISVVSFSQSIIVIDKNKTTAPLFDDAQPFSFIAMLKSGLYHLGNFDLMGMSDSLVNTLSVEEKNKTLKFAKMFQDYEFDENGEQKTVFNPETGMYDFVFIPPDTVYASLDNIERIVLNISEDNAEKKTIEFWKRYGGKLQRVLTLNADVLELQGFKTIRPVKDEKQSFWLNKNDPKSLWNQMRDASLKLKSDFEEGIVDTAENGFLMEFFPRSSIIPLTAYFGGIPSIVESQYVNEVNYLVVLNEDYNARLPFQFTYGDSLNASPDYNAKLEKEFNKVVTINLLSDYPLLDMDPDSPNFGNELIITHPDGTMEYVYPDPILSYLWCDYDNTELYEVEEFVFNENTDEMRTKMVGLCFVKKSSNGKQEIVSFTRTEGQFSSFFEDYPSEKLNELEWNIIFKSEVEKSANTYDLLNPKDVKRLSKRNAKLKK